MTDQKPSVGRIVHYQPSGKDYDMLVNFDLSKPMAAMITDVRAKDGMVDLTVLPPRAQLMLVTAPHAPNDVPTPGHWNWPPRV